MKKSVTIVLIIASIFILPIQVLSKPRDIHVEWNYQYDGNVAGFRLYRENNPVCEILDPNASSMDCHVNLPDGESFFTLTAIFRDGTESQHSPSFSSIFSSKLLAVMTADPREGNTPLAVAFNATSSAGNILNYDWTFGDGKTGAGSLITHTFFSGGYYTVTLKITDNMGAVDRENVSVIVTSPSTSNIPPLAVISSSSSVGAAPLPVQFDGTGSTDSDGSVIAFDWDMGDGGTASGALTENTYLSAGTFHPALTVTDNGGLTDSNSTPVLVTDPPAGNNFPPIVDFTASIRQGTAPLSVTLDAGKSFDPDGMITDYLWSFGDGTNAAGVLVDHIYIQAGVYAIKLKVTDNTGATAEAVYTVTAQSGFPEPSFNVELGELTIDNTWSHVDLMKEFINPIVIIGPLSSNDSDPSVVRVKNVDPAGFDIRIQEWDYLDGLHGYETVHYIVIEKGTHTLADGSKLEAGTITGGIRFQPYAFQTTFQTEPVILTTISSVKEEDAVTGRVRKLTANGFEFKLSEQESNRFSHADETVGYIAWETGIGTLGQLHYEVGKTTDSVTNLWHGVGFQDQLTADPFFFAGMQTYDSGENSTVRYQNLTLMDVLVKIEEETSKDSETDHTTETVGYVVFKSSTE